MALAPVTELDRDFSSDDASAVSWAEGRRRLETATGFWVSTVRPDGRPHLTPLIAVWHDDAMVFTTGPTERKAKNLAQNPRCILVTGSDAWDHGFDVVVEGEAERVADTDALQRVAAAYEAKYGAVWHFDVRDDVFVNDAGGEAYVFRVAPVTAFGFSKGEPFGQTRWQFDRA